MRAAALGLLTLLAASAAANPVVIMPDKHWTDGKPGWGLIAGQKTPLKILSEDLVISPDLVRVRYVIANDTDTMRHEWIGFPVVDISPGDLWVKGSPLAVWSEVADRRGLDPLDFMAFRVRVDGRPKEAQGQQNAYLFKYGHFGPTIPVTDVLKAAGLPLMMLERSDIIARLPDATKHALYDRHLLEAFEVNPAPGTYPAHYKPAWHVDTTFSWQQDFPAHHRFTVEVGYRPMTAGTAHPIRGGSLVGWPEPGCFADPAARSDDWVMRRVMLRSTGYIVMTANYWNGPIGRFHLTLDKQKPNALLSACVDHPLTKTGPTTYEFTAERYAPQNDIRTSVLE